MRCCGLVGRLCGVSRQDRLQVAVARLPYHEGYPGAPQNTLADGASLWVAEGLNKQDYLASPAWVSYWLSPEAQVGWQRDSGYLPSIVRDCWPRTVNCCNRRWRASKSR